MILANCLFAVLAINLVSSNYVGKFVFHRQDDKVYPTTLSILNKPDSINIAPNPGPIPADEISSVLSLSLGLSVPKDITWNGLLAGNLFKRPKSVLLFSIDNLPKGANLNLQAQEKIPVKSVDDVSSIGDVYAISSSVSLAEHVNGLIDGRAITVSISADEQIAAMGYSRGDSSTTAIWNEMSDSWKIASGDGQVKTGLSKHDVLKRMESILPTGFMMNMEEMKVQVNTNRLQFTYNLENHADFNLFSELVAMEWQYEQLSLKKKEIKDGASDVYLFAVSALKAIEEKYGADSKQMKGALLLLESYIPKLVSKFTALYSGDIFVVGLTMESELSHMEPHKDKVDTILNSLKDQVAHKFDISLPELHVSNDLESKAMKHICETIQGAISTFAPSLKFKCNDYQSSKRKLHRRSLLQIVSATQVKDLNLASQYTPEFAVIFNIWFWLLVVLVIATYAIAVGMWNMDPGRDSIIYRLTQQKIKSE